MRLAWLTDIHLNFVSRRKLAAFIEEVAAEKPDAVLLGGEPPRKQCNAGKKQS